MSGPLPPPLSSSPTEVPTAEPGVAPKARPCLNCGEGVLQAFCPACGQDYEAAARLTLGGTFADVVAEFVQVEFASREFWRSLWTLVSRPGLLTREWVAGRRVPYYSPAALFLLLNGVYFLVTQWTGLQLQAGTYTLPVGMDRLAAEAVARGLPLDAYVQLYGDTWGAIWPIAMVFLVPCLMPVLEVLYRRETFALHAVFAFHFGSLYTVVATASTLYQRAVLGAPSAVLMGAIVFGLLPVLYLTVALAKVYGGWGGKNLARAVVVVAAVLIVPALLGYAAGWVAFWLT